MAEETVQAVDCLSLELLWYGQIGLHIVNRRRNRTWDDMEEPVDLPLGDSDRSLRNGEGRHEKSTA